jgi:hypothetical protein
MLSLGPHLPTPVFELGSLSELSCFNGKPDVVEWWQWLPCAKEENSQEPGKTPMEISAPLSDSEDLICLSLFLNLLQQMRWTHQPVLTWVFNQEYSLILARGPNYSFSFLFPTPPSSRSWFTIPANIHSHQATLGRPALMLGHNWILLAQVSIDSSSQTCLHISNLKSWAANSQP